MEVLPKFGSPQASMRYLNSISNISPKRTQIEKKKLLKKRFYSEKSAKIQNVSFLMI